MNQVMIDLYNLILMSRYDQNPTHETRTVTPTPMFIIVKIEEFLLAFCCRGYFGGSLLCGGLGTASLSLCSYNNFGAVFPVVRFFFFFFFVFFFFFFFGFLNGFFFIVLYGLSKLLGFLQKIETSFLLLYSFRATWGSLEFPSCRRDHLYFFVWNEICYYKKKNEFISWDPN